MSPVAEIVHPEQLRVLSTAVENFCVIASIDAKSPQREQAARLALVLFRNGVQTPDELKAALFQRLLHTKDDAIA
jgi:hypothetical protein